MLKKKLKSLTKGGYDFFKRIEWADFFPNGLTYMELKNENMRKGFRNKKSIRLKNVLFFQYFAVFRPPKKP